MSYKLYKKYVFFKKITLYNNIDGDRLSKRFLQQMGPLPRRKQTVRKVLPTPIPWEEEPLNHRPRCSGNLLSLWDGPGHDATSKTSKYSSGWVIMTDAELARLWGLKWELWQCLNAAAPGLEAFMGWDWERQCRASWGAGWEQLWQGNPAASATPPLLQKATNTQ